MNPGELIVILIVIIPAVSIIFYKLRIQYASVTAGIIDLILTVLLYFYKPLPDIFFIDNITIIFILMVLSIYVLSLLYSPAYLKGTKMGIRKNNYYMLIDLFAVSMLFTLVINNYGLMWVGIEATTISSALLLIAKKTDTSLEATWRYIVIVSAGVAFAFFSVILIYYSLGTLQVSTAIISHVYSKMIVVAVAIALIGFGTKVGVFPVHTWLPDAHSEAPSPVSAMFSGVLLPTALYVLYRVYEIAPIRELYVWFAVVSIVAASIFLGHQTRYKRMFAYSTMENMNLALLGFAVGGTFGVIGAVLLLISHSFGKAGAFYSSGNILRFTGKSKIFDIGGIYRSMPVTSSSLLLSSLAVTGAPPFGTFFGEFLIFAGLLQEHQYAAFIIVAIAVATAFISMNYNVSSMLFHGSSDYKEENRMMPAISLFSSIVPIVIGIVYMVMYSAMV